jgi:hypothetical protein
MKSVVAVGIVFLVSCFPMHTSAQEPAVWKYFGGSELKGTELALFYSEPDIVRLPASNIRVWTKGLPKSALDQQFDNMSPNLVDKVAKKIAKAYVPPIGDINELTSDQIIDIVAYEEIANARLVSPASRILFELDCEGRKYRTLSIFIELDGKSSTSEKQSEWGHIPPETNMTNLSGILCVSQRK